MSTKDVIKSSVYESIVGGGALTASSIIFILVIAAIIGIYIFAVYKLTSKAAFYSRDLNVTIAGLPVIVAAIMVAMQSNLIVSLGMVGALSIVRFRTAIKDPMDLVFLFWSISVGIICGARLYVIAVILSVFVTIVIFALDKMPVAKAPKILVVNAQSLEAEDDILDIVEGYSTYYRVKSRNLSADQLDMVVELRVKDEKALIGEIHDLKDVHAVSLLAHDGEVTF